MPRIHLILELDFLFVDRDLQTVDLAEPRAIAPTAWWVNGHYAKPVKGEQPAHAVLFQVPEVAAGPYRALRLSPDNCRGR